MELWSKIGRFAISVKFAKFVKEVPEHSILGGRNSITPEPGYLSFAETYTYLNRRLSILNDLILDSSVEGETPSLAAAPFGPDTRPLV